MRLFNEFTAGSDLLRIWPRTTTPNSIAAFSMIHLLYDRVDRDSALINDPLPSRYSSSPTISIADSRGGARSGGKRRRGGRGKEERFEFFAARHVRTFPFYLYRAGDGEDRVLWGDRFDLDLLLPLDYEGSVGHFDDGTT